MYTGISLALDFLSVIVLMISMSMIQDKRDKSQSLIHYIYGIVFCVIAMLVSDAVYWAFLGLGGSPLVTGAFVAKEIYYVFNTMVIVLWVCYVGRLIIGKQRFAKYYAPIYLGVFAVNTVLVIINIFEKTMFRLGPDGSYIVINSGMITYTVLNYVCVIIALFSILVRRKKIRLDAFVLLLLYQLPVLLTEIISFSVRSFSLVCGYALTALILLSVFQRYSSYREIDRIIDNAIEHKLFEVYYQPIYSVRDGNFMACEALLRLKDREKGFLSPLEVVGAAEETGKIGKIGEAVIDEVCRFISSPEFENLGIKYVNINVSMVEMENSDISGKILAVMDQYGVPQEKIRVELTETIIAKDDKMALANMIKLDSAGIRLALDDFGSGYSNVYRLAVMPFSVIKLDSTLIRNCSDSKVRTIIGATAGLMKQLGVRVLAEGVENEEEYDLMVEAGADFIQGFYFSRPLPKESFIKFIEDSKEA